MDDQKKLYFWNHPPTVYGTIKKVQVVEKINWRKAIVEAAI